MSKRLKCGVVLLAIILSLFIPMFWHIFIYNNTVMIDVEYSDDHIEGVDQPMENLAIDIYIDSVFYDRFYTNSMGQVEVVLSEQADYTFKYEWQSVEYSVDIDDTQDSVINLELDTWSLDSEFKLTNLSLIVNKTIDLLIWDGGSYVYLVSVDVINGDIVGGSLIGLFIGDYMFENANDTFSITYGSEYDSLPTEIFIELKCAYIS